MTDSPSALASVSEFPARNAENAYSASRNSEGHLKPDGTIVNMAGLFYKVDSTANTAAKSATGDLIHNNVAVIGLVPLGQPQPGHYGPTGTDAERGAALLRMVKAGDTDIHIPSATYELAEELVLQDTATASQAQVASVTLDGDVTLNFTAGSTSSPKPGFVTLNQYPILIRDSNGSGVQLSSAVSAGATEITFNNAPVGLSVGDWFCIYNIVPGSYSPFNTSYRAGEWCQVREVDTADKKITFTRPLSAGYANPQGDNTKIQFAKHPAGTFRVLGKGRIIVEQPASADRHGIFMRGFVNCDVSAFHSKKATEAGLALRHCIGLTGTGCVHTGKYGMTVTGCQNVRMSGLFTGVSENAVTVGMPITSDPSWDVPCREVHIGGEFLRETSGVGAAHWSGNCEYCLFDGLFTGGLSGGGGPGLKARGRAVALDDNPAFLATEMISPDLDLAGMVFESALNARNGVINLQESGALSSNLKYDGTLTLAGVTIDAPGSDLGIYIRGRNMSKKVAIDATGMQTTLKKNGGFNSVDVASGTTMFTDLYMDGMQVRTDDNGTLSDWGSPDWNFLRDITSYHGAVLEGALAVTPVTNTSSVTARTTDAISFPGNWRTPGEKQSKSTITYALLAQAGLFGGEPSTLAASPISDDNKITFTVQTSTGRNFQSTDAGKVTYRISLN